MSGKCDLLSEQTAKAGNRHFVTVVGIDSKVKDASELSPEKILVYDCYYGEVRTLADCNRTVYGYDRDEYRVMLPANDYLASIGKEESLLV